MSNDQLFNSKSQNFISILNNCKKSNENVSELKKHEKICSNNL